MTPDDPRHGSNKGYVAGCRENCCRRPHMRELKKWRMRGPQTIDATGTHRRIRALEAIGWPRAEQSRRLGKTREYLNDILKRDRIRKTTADAIAELYDELSMHIPIDDPRRSVGQNAVHEKTRRRAARLGLVPPLAWDDIDDPAAEPWTDDRPKRPGRPEIVATQAEEFDFLIRQGESKELAAARLGIKRMDSFVDQRRRLEKKREAS